MSPRKTPDRPGEKPNRKSTRPRKTPDRPDEEPMQVDAGLGADQTGIRRLLGTRGGMDRGRQRIPTLRSSRARIGTRPFAGSGVFSRPPRSRLGPHPRTGGGALVAASTERAAAERTMIAAIYARTATVRMAALEL
jgi:hypothetical protein